MRDELRRLLTVVRRRWLTVALGRTVGRVGLVTLGLWLAILGLDRWLRPADGGLVLLVVAAGSIVLWGAIRAVRAFRRVPNDRQVARFVEERCPELEDRLASAAEVANETGASEVRRLVLRDAVERAGAIDLGRVVPRRHVAWALAAVLAIGLAGLGVGVISRDAVSRISRAVWLYAVPFGASLDVDPGSVRIQAGTSLSVRATISGTAGAPHRTPPVVTLRHADGAVEIQTMDAVEERSDRFEAVIPAVTRSFSYQVSVASLRSAEYQVEALVAPRIERVDVAYEYPAFAHRSPRVERGGGDVYAPRGTRVTLEIHFDKPMRDGILSMSSGAELSLRRRGSQTLEASFDVLRDDRYRLMGWDVDGLSTSESADYFVRAVPDRPPQVDVRRPARDREVTPLEEVVVEARAEDDFGLQRFDLHYTVSGAAERVVSLLPEPGARTASSRQTIFMETLDVAPGDVISYYVRAGDTETDGPDRDARSDIYFLEVRPFDREFEEAQSESTDGMAADDVSHLIEVQKQIVVATWRLDGQAPETRASADVAVVADAQEDLRWAAQRAAQRMLTRELATGSGRSPRGREEMQAMREAVEAMSAAEARLRAEETTAAVPHEMAALHQLRRARVETRRQVARDQDRRQGGQGGAAQEDLSALFDRDLRRDQQTNYEEPSGPTPPPGDEATDDLQERLAALAERQEALSDAQDKLAGEREALEQDELRRRLERLTRDQEALQREAEALARRVEATGGQSSSQRGEQASAAAEQMRETARALRSGDADEASAQGRRAADALRALEDQLRRASSPDINARLDAARFEAQQLADRHRELARELRDRKDADQEGAALATRSESLADRADRLTDRLEALRSAPDLEPQTSERVTSALRELETAQVAASDREIAESLRASDSRDASISSEDAARPDDSGRRSESRSDADADGGAPEPVVEQSDRLAQSLERVARQLARAAEDADGERMAAELDRLQAVRERLKTVTAGLPPDQADGPRDSPGVESSDVGGAESEAGRLVRQVMESPSVMDALRELRPGAAADLERWAEHWESTAAPGTEAFKQDMSEWESLRDDLLVALEHARADTLRARREAETADRARVGPDEAIPDDYRRAVEQYYRAIATADPLPR